MGSSSLAARSKTTALTIWNLAWKTNAGVKGLMLAVCAIGLQGCQKEAPTTFLSSEPLPSQTRTTVAPVTFLRLSERSVDVVWVVDNSGSMGPYQTAVANNAERFMQNFARRSAPWQVALITTDDSRQPLLGFNNTRNLTNSSLDPVTVFRSAVTSAGTGGSSTEKTISPFQNAIRGAPNYLRPGVPLVIVILSDAEEQSTVPVRQFYNELLALKGGDASLVKIFGILAPRDWCTAGEGWNWQNSRYKQLIDLSSGVTAKLCDPIGSTLDNLGQFLARQTSPRIALSVRPKLSTLRIRYRGVDLPGGDEAAGGLWYYDYEDNSVKFYDLSFAPAGNESVEVIFRPEDGLPD